MAADLVALAVAMVLAAAVHYSTLSLGELVDSIRQHAFSLVAAAAVYPACFHLFRLYRYAWRFASLETLWSVIGANTVGVVGLVIAELMLSPPAIFAPSMLFVFWLLSIVLVGAMRVALRVLNIRRFEAARNGHGGDQGARTRRAVILGAGGHGARLYAALQEDPDHQYEVVAFLDDDPAKHDTFIRNVRVVGPLDHLYHMLANHAVDEVLVAITRVGGARIRDFVLACRAQGVGVKIVPGLNAMLNGRAQLRLEEFSVEDLLRRQPVNTDLAEVGSCITSRRVLVTGAGGSIGTELCRQVSALGPAALYLFGHGEHSIHRVHTELCANFPELADRYHMVIGSVGDERRVHQVVRDRAPHIVFHTAAHKHVPIMEQNVLEAIKNNVLGTYHVADACGAAGADRMVLISTDKAVSPSSVMGATKWLCEEIVRAMSSRYEGTTYLAVRFGNVLDSRGSVVPVFREQLRRGGPLTVTHPDVTRYFMTIREAVQLVLQAAAGESGELYLLDMGEPVRILDLARDMIRLSGFEPDVDIPITFTGLRPGEKLDERLVWDEEEIVASERERLSLVRREQYTPPEQVFEMVRRFQEHVVKCDEAGARRYLEEVVPSLAEELEGTATADLRQGKPRLLPSSPRADVAGGGG
jgi:FlaA1/EpsC-like NDP-sugar epimerase